MAISVKSGLWSDPTVWDTESLPADFEDVTIDLSHAVIFDLVGSSITEVGMLYILGTLTCVQYSRLRANSGIMMDVGAELVMSPGFAFCIILGDFQTFAFSDACKIANPWLIQYGAASYVSYTTSPNYTANLTQFYAPASVRQLYPIELEAALGSNVGDESWDIRNSAGSTSFDPRIPFVAVFKNGELLDTPIAISNVGASWRWSYFLDPEVWSVGDHINVQAYYWDDTQYVLQVYRGTVNNTRAMLERIAAKTDTLGTGTVQVNSLVLADGSIVIFRAADHKARDGRSWDFGDPGTWPDLTGATLTLTLRKIGVNTDPPPLQLSGTLIAATEDTPAIVRFEASRTETAGLAPSANSGDYLFDVVATLANTDKLPLIPEGSATVVSNITGTVPAGSPRPITLNAGSQW